jgi:hypothetical protein
VHLAKRITFAAASAVAAVGLAAGTAGIANASAGAPHWGYGSTAVTRIYNASTVPGNGGTWASDSVLRVATIHGGYPVALSNCGETTGVCYAFTATVRDNGGFRADRGALTPNQVVAGKHIKSAVQGSVNGTENFGVFYANAEPNASLVPRFYNGGFFPSPWPQLFFPSGTTITGLSVGPWAENYSAWTRCGFQHWTEASYNSYGDTYGSGNITGCAPPRWW